MICLFLAVFYQFQHCRDTRVQHAWTREASPFFSQRTLIYVEKKKRLVKKRQQQQTNMPADSENRRCFQGDHSHLILRNICKSIYPTNRQEFLIIRNRCNFCRNKSIQYLLRQIDVIFVALKLQFKNRGARVFARFVVVISEGLQNILETCNHKWSPLHYSSIRNLVSIR